MAINLLHNVGPFIIPEPFFEAGAILSTIWTALILAISLNSAMSANPLKISKDTRTQSSNKILPSNDHKVSMISNYEEGALFAKDFRAMTISEDSAFLQLTMEDVTNPCNFCVLAGRIDIEMHNDQKSSIIIIHRCQNTENFRALTDAFLPFRCSLLIQEHLQDQTHHTDHHLDPQKDGRYQLVHQDCVFCCRDSHVPHFLYYHNGV